MYITYYGGKVILKKKEEKKMFWLIEKTWECRLTSIFEDLLKAPLGCTWS